MAMPQEDRRLASPRLTISKFYLFQKSITYSSASHLPKQKCSQLKCLTWLEAENPLDIKPSLRDEEAGHSNYRLN